VTIAFLAELSEQVGLPEGVISVLLADRETRPMPGEFSVGTSRITEFPVTRAGMILEVTDEKGEFHGMTATTTPTASRRTTLRTGEAGPDGASISSRANSSDRRPAPVQRPARGEHGADLAGERLGGLVRPCRAARPDPCD
jgi:hypothetical protein